MALTLAQLRQTQERNTKIINVPAWAVDGDDEVCIAELSGTDQAELLALSAKTREMSGEYILALVARVIVDPETGERVFTDEHTEALAAKPGEGLRVVFDEAVQFNRLGPGDIEDLAKNSEGTAGDDSPTGSPSTADTSTPE